MLFSTRFLDLVSYSFYFVPVACLYHDSSISKHFESGYPHFYLLSVHFLFQYLINHLGELLYF